MTTTCTACPVRPLAICAGLDDRALDALRPLGRRRRLARGEALVWAGGEGHACANLIRGAMKLEAATASGAGQIVDLVFPGGFVGQPYASEAGFTATALTDTELCVFPGAVFRSALAEHPRLEAALLRRTLAALEEARGRMVSLARGTAMEKVAGMLRETAERAGVGQDAAFELPLTRGEIAELLGLTIETVSRQLSRLVADKVIARVGARGILVRDRAALDARAG